jgi:hypothetical protein
MQTAKQINDARRKPLTVAELASIKQKIDNGKMCLMRRGEFCCLECGNPMWMHYVGETNEAAEWELQCFECGEIYYI